MLKGFFAYSSRPDVCELIKTATNLINESKQYLITTWEELSISGKFVIDTICEKINEADIFLVDLTYLNHNVLFELGYALAKNKRIVVFLDTSVTVAKQNYNRLNFSSIGYIEFTNSAQLANRFLTENVSADLDNTLQKRMYTNYPSPPIDNLGILYLKNNYDTNASIKLSNLLNNSKLKPLTIDDPKETLTHDVEWYLKHTLQSYAVVGHLTDDERENSDFHNAKVSLCIGMGLGFNKKVFMIVKHPFYSPLDYKHLLRIHKTISDCTKLTSEWLSEIEIQNNSATTQKITSERSQSNSIQDVDIGDYIAEQEKDALFEYYIDTVNTKEALRSGYSLFIGRKGTGKSALLYKIEHDLSLNKNHICTIKPIAYEISGLIKVLKEIPENSERSYLMESLWKYLIYTELARSIKKRIDDRPLYIDHSPQEKKLIEFINLNESLILPDFWERFENIIERCIKIKGTETNKKIKISESLHDSMISKLRFILLEQLSSYEKVVILIDNLDKAWEVDKHVELLSTFLFGLISVSNRIKIELSPKSSNTDFSLLIFLRSDIFAYIYKLARERDKIKYQLITWDDSELLLSVIEERLKYNFPEYSIPQIWKNYFCSSIDNIPIKDYIIKNILPRPRDIIFLILEALKITVAKNHSKIEEDDIKNAQKRYSQYALDSLLVESEIDSDFEKLLYEFVGCPYIISKARLEEIIRNTFDNKYTYEYLTKILCERSFLGRKIADNTFRYQYDFDDAIIRSLEKKYVSGGGAEEYEINIPFRKYLEIT